MAFRGWPAEALEFFEGLEADNSKVYWQENKKVYEESVKQPLEELLAELKPRYGDGKIFRPYRDVRFSADKAPYKTNIAATVATGGYISLSADGLGAGSGYYMLAADQLERFRQAIADDKLGKALERKVATSRTAGYEVTAHETLKTAPRGYPKDHPRIDLLRMKGLILWRQWPVAAWLGTARAKTHIVDLFTAAKPLNQWMDANVGPSTLPGWGDR